MSEPLINILIRTSYRPKAFARMMKSINDQTYNNIRLIVSYDDEKALDYVIEHLQWSRFEGILIKETKVKEKVFYYDSYINTLKEEVKEGYFFVLDDSDKLASKDSISNLIPHLNGIGVICQMSRNGRKKPNDDYINHGRIIKGKIGMPCLVLHNKYKNAAYLDGSKTAADYEWIKEVSRKVKLKFCNFVLVECGERDYGRMENE